MDPTLFARGVVLGFTIAAAVGPISLLTIRRTLAHGRVYGLASGMGVALADATYGGDRRVRADGGHVRARRGAGGARAYRRRVPGRARAGGR